MIESPGNVLISHRCQVVMLHCHIVVIAKQEPKKVLVKLFNLNLKKINKLHTTTYRRKPNEEIIHEKIIYLLSFSSNIA